MSEETLFAEPTSPAPTEGVTTPSTSAEPSINIPAPAVDLIGEGKKYHTVEDALASLPHAQEHIARIEQENRDMREKLMSNDKLDQVLQKLSTPATPVTEQTTQEQSTGDESLSLDRDQLSQLVQQEIKQVETVNQQKANVNTVESKLREVYGEKAGSVFNEKASSVGMTPTQLTALAKVAPDAVLALVGVNKPGDTGIPQHTYEGVNLASVGEIGETKPKKNVMLGASTKDVIDEWKACAPE